MDKAAVNILKSGLRAVLVVWGRGIGAEESWGLRDPRGESLRVWRAF